MNFKPIPCFDWASMYPTIKSKKSSNNRIVAGSQKNHSRWKSNVCTSLWPMFAQKRCRDVRTWRMIRNAAENILKPSLFKFLKLQLNISGDAKLLLFEILGTVVAKIDFCPTNRVRIWTLSIWIWNDSLFCPTRFAVSYLPNGRTLTLVANLDHF